MLPIDHGGGVVRCCCLDANSPLDATAAADMILTVGLHNQRHHSFVPPDAAAGPCADDDAWENHQTDNRLG